MRSPLKRLLEAVAVRSGIPRFGLRLRRHDALILAFHNVVPDRAPLGGDPSLHLPLGKFCAFLDELVAHHDIVSLPTLLQKPSSGSSGPRVAITFDDAYRGAVTDGVRELAARGLPATVFVSPAFVGGREFWWDNVAGGLDTLRFADLRQHALVNLGGEHDDICRWATQNDIALSAMPPFSRVATEEELHLAAEQPGITFASHTWSHPNLTRMSPERVREEFVRSWEWLRDRFEPTIAWLSYPYGLTSASVEKVAEDVGFDAAVCIEGGWTQLPLRSKYATSRLNIPAGLSLNGFALRAAGL